MSGKRRNSTIGPKWEDNYLYKGQHSIARYIKAVIIFQQHFVFNVEIKRSVQLFQKIGNIIRSSDNLKWQACMRETDADRSWQAGHAEPWTSKRDEQGRSNAIHLCLVTYSPSPLIQMTWRHMCSHTPEREISDSEGDASKVETQKRKHSIHAYFRKNQKRSILRTEKYGDLITAEHKILSEGCQSRNNHRYAAVVQVLATQWNPCQTKTLLETDKNLRKFTETVEEAKSYSYRQFIRIWQVLWRIIIELSNNYTSSIRNKRNCRTSCTSNKRSDISRIFAIWIEW